MQVYDIKDVKDIKINGRTAGDGYPLALFWTASGLEMNVTGSELYIEIEVDYERFEPWITVLINGEVVSRQMLEKGRRWLCLFRGMNKEKVKKVEVLKETQAMADDSKCHLVVHQIKTDGKFMPTQEKPYKIEFVGDSITSGEGTVGARSEEDWIPMWFSAINHYGYLTAKKLGASYRIVSQSGWGTMTGWDNDPHCNVPQYYEKVCGLLKGEINEQLGAHEDYDFSKWAADVVVINLGTNDGGAFHSAPWIDPETHKSYKQRIEADGSFNKDDLMRFEGAVYAFVKKVRKYNPKAHIVWCYGMLGYEMMPSIYKAIDKYIAETQDRKVSVLQLTNTNKETVGARCHPGLLAHQNAAEILSDYLMTLLESR